MVRNVPEEQFSSYLFQRVLTLLQLIATGTEVYVSTMTSFLSYLYNALEDTLNCMKSLKLKSCPGEIVTYLCVVILVDTDPLESDWDF